MIPDNVEKIIMTKEDYDRNVEQLLLEKLRLEEENEKLKMQNDILISKKLYERDKNAKKIKIKLEREKELKEKINKAVKYLISHCVISDEWIEVKPLDFVPTGHISYKPMGKKHVENVLNILLEGENEDE